MQSKYEPSVCNNKMSFEECELAILRQAVDESEEMKGKKTAMNEDVKKIVDLLEKFLQEKPLICYGGTAINNILPKQSQFYNRELEIPDYDFYSKNALSDAIELANRYADAGYIEVEAKSGVHHGTYKVFVNFIPIADITFLHEDIFDALFEDSISVAGIKYCPANFLRMNMYLELSRPMGDVSRWEKVFKRLVLLNKHYPVNPSLNCNMVEFQKKLEEKTLRSIEASSAKASFAKASFAKASFAKASFVKASFVKASSAKASSAKASSKIATSKNDLQVESKNIEEDIHIVIRDTLISMDALFIGGYACSLYSEYMTDSERHKVEKTADFDVIVEDVEKAAIILKERIEDKIGKKIVMIQHAEINEIIPKHIEIKIDDDSVAFLYEPIACHNYNTITLDNGLSVNVATIDTLLSFYLAFMYAKKKYYNKDKIICMAMFLFDVQEKNRLKQKGLLKRFSLQCMGKQSTLEMIRSDKAIKYKELKDKKDTPEYDEWFLKYNPHIKRRQVTRKRDFQHKEKMEFVFSPQAKHEQQARPPILSKSVKTAKKKKYGKKKKGKKGKKTFKNFLF